MGISLSETNKSEEYSEAQEEGNSPKAEASEVDEESDEGASAVKVAGMGETVFGCHIREQASKDEGGTKAEQMDRW